MNDETFERFLDSGPSDGAADAASSAQRALQARIDSSLRKRFAAPAERELAQVALRASGTAWPWERERRTWLALAALVLIALGIGTWPWRANEGATRSLARCMQDAYVHHAAGAPGSGPTIDACGDLEADWVRSKLPALALGCTTLPLPPAPIPPILATHTCAIEGQIAATGTPFTSCVRALVDGRPVLLWTAPLAQDPKPWISPSCGFVAYRGELDGRVLYEYSPLHEPVLLRSIGALISDGAR